jgi:hypothetical protein
MASLMQGFAEARQRRLQERANFLAEQQLARQQREKALQAQSEATAVYLAHAEQTRLAWEQGRQAIAENALASRQEELQNRASQVSQYLQDISSNRTQQAAEDSEERAQEVRTRTFKTRSQLKHIHKARIRSGKADRDQRQQLTQERAAFTQMQIEDINKARLANAKVAAEQRSQEVQARTAEVSAQIQATTEQRLAQAKQDAVSRAKEFSDRVANVKTSLEQLEATRLAEAQAQATKLNDFRANLSASVWAGSRSVAVPQPIAKVSANTAYDNSASLNPKPKKKGSKSESVVVTPEPEIAKPVAVEPPKEAPKETPKASSKIEQFVVDYVAQLSTNSSLLEVVNDRDTVRDLLAQGANTLKVDPSDILNTLLQMAEGS